MSVVSVDLPSCSYALETLKNPEMKLKPQQVKAIRHVYGGKDAGLCVVPYRVSASATFQYYALLCKPYLCNSMSYVPCL